MTDDEVAAQRELLARVKADPALVFVVGKDADGKPLGVAPDAYLSAIAAQSKSLADASMSNEKSREKIKSLAYAIARAKTSIDDAGKAMGEDARKSLNAINDKRKRIREELEELQERVRAPLVEWEKQERARIASHDAVLAGIASDGNVLGHETSVEIQNRINRLKRIAPADLDEFETQATAALTSAMSTLIDALGAAKKREDEARELADLREKKRLADEAAAKAQAAAEAEARAKEREREREKAEWLAEIAAEKAAATATANAEAAAKMREDEAKLEAAKREDVLREEAEAAKRALAKRQEDEAAKLAEAARRASDRQHKAKVREEIAHVLATVIEIALPIRTDEGNAAEIVAQAILDEIEKGGVPHLAVMW